MLGRIVLLLAMAGACWGLAGESVIVELSATPIASPELIFAGPARLAVGSAGWIPLPEKGVKIPGEQQSGRFTLAGEEVFITWRGNRDFTITAGGKTVGLRAISRSYGLQPSTVTLSDGRHYTLAFPVAQVGRTPEGIQAVIFYRAGASQNGRLDDEIVSIYDANTDGTYEPVRDSFRVGVAERPMIFAPIAEYFATSRGIYRIDEIAADGSRVVCTRHDGPAGKLDIQHASGQSELSLIIVSTDGTMSAAATAGSKVRPPLLLLPGEYHVKYGIVATVPQGRVTAVLQPDSIQPITIEEGSTARLELGPPYQLGFEARSDGMRFTLDAGSFKLTGRSGETYINYRWAQPPDVTIHGGGRSQRLERAELEDGMMLDYEGKVPDGMGLADRKVVITGVVEGLGPVKGEAMLRQ